MNPQLGDWPDINRIGSEFHLMSDLVLNHVSSQGAWFNAYRQGQHPYDKFFFEASPDDDLSDVVRPRTTPLLQAVETSGGTKHVWCTFSHDQIDLDFRNPEVLLEFLQIIRLQVKNGVRIIRLDAVAFLWKAAGISSIHRPQAKQLQAPGFGLHMPHRDRRGRCHQIPDVNASFAQHRIPRHAKWGCDGRMSCRHTINAKRL